MKNFLILSLLALSLTGCWAGAVVTTAEAAKTAAQDRSLGNRIDDNAIALKINDKFAQANFDNVFLDVSTRIFEGRVMLTGAVAKEDYKEKAEELTWQVTGIKEVINEIQVAPNGIAAYSEDVLLQKAVRGKLLLTKTIRSSNYEVDVVNGVAYIIGIARDETERRNVIEVARRIKGISQVVSHVILGNDPRRGPYAGNSE